jgi:hypothetical protein
MICLNAEDSQKYKEVLYTLKEHLKLLQKDHAVLISQ